MFQGGHQITITESFYLSLNCVIWIICSLETWGSIDYILVGRKMLDQESYVLFFRPHKTHTNVGFYLVSKKMLMALILTLEP